MSASIVGCAAFCGRSAVYYVHTGDVRVTMRTGGVLERNQRQVKREPLCCRRRRQAYNVCFNRPISDASVVFITHTW